ncbi:hypothetical protein LCGC14_3079180, partial [marine sediment metagenome]
PVDLPPAGYERNEELLKRVDKLEALVEEKINGAEVHSIDPRSFQIDPAMQHLLDERGRFHVSKADPVYQYTWVYTGQGGQMVWQKKYWGWEVVQGNMLEAKEAQKAEDTTRRIADTLLMRMRLDVYYKLEDALARKRQAIEQGSTNNLMELGQKYAKHGIKVHTDGDGQFASRRGPNVLSTLESRAASGFGVHREASKQVGQMAKDGTLPGVTHPNHRKG